MKAREIITRAFYEVNQSTYKIQDIDLQDGLRYLNRMMAKLQSEGYNLGYESLSEVDSDISAPDTVVLGIVKNLAMTLWPQYNTDPLNPLIKFSADRAKKTMLIQGFDGITPTQYSDNLSKGSGNYQKYDDNFYSNDRDQSKFLEVENG